MPATKKRSDAKLAQGKELARRLYDLSPSRLESLSSEDRQRLLAEFPLLGPAEFDDIRRQVFEAKTYHQERVGWQTVPHDITVLALVVVTTFSSLRAAVVASVACLVLLESAFQVYFSRRIYRPLSLLVWLTYPAYLWFGYVLYQRQVPIGWVLLAVLLAWGGTFLLGAVARVPMHLYLEARRKGAKAPSRKSEPPAGR